MDPLDQHEIARISRALVRTVRKAVSLVDAEDYGDELQRLLRHAWKVHEMLHQKQMNTDDSWLIDELRTVCSQTGSTLQRIGSLIEEEHPPEATP